MKKFTRVVIKSPIVAIQLVIYFYMTWFGIRAIFQIFGNKYIEWIYTIGLIYSLGLTIAALFKTINTEPGYVTPELVEKLKNQLLLPR